MRAVIALALALACNGCALLGTPLGKTIARTAIDIARDTLVERLSGSEPVTEPFCVGEERVCYVPDPSQAAEVILRDFEERGVTPDRERTICFDAAEETGNDRVPGLICYVPEAEEITAAAVGTSGRSSDSATRSSRVGCHFDNNCESTTEDIEHDRHGTEAAPTAQRDGAGEGHREGSAEGADVIHPGGRRADGRRNASDGEGHGQADDAAVGPLVDCEPDACRVIQLWLARASIGECDFRLPDCHASTWFTLERRLREVIKPRWPSRTLDWMAIKYCAVFRGVLDARKRWVRGLRADGSKPAAWPAASWERHGPMWSDIHDRAGAFLRGEVKDPCKGRPIHLGGLMDRARMSPHKWCMVECGETGDQRFWELCS